MTTKQSPTDEQLEAFWKWCGFTVNITPSATHPGDEYWEWHDPSGKEVEGDPPFLDLNDLNLIFRYWEWHDPSGKEVEGDPPFLDLNSIFRYAVPRLAENQSLHLSKYARSGKFTARIGMYPTAIDADPALALFWAIWAVIKTEGEL